MERVEFMTEIGPDQVIRPPPGTILPKGTVRVVVRKQPAETASISDVPLEEHPLYKLVLEAERDPPDLPPDLAEQHDHYLYGVPKHDTRRADPPG